MDLFDFLAQNRDALGLLGAAALTAATLLALIAQRRAAARLKHETQARAGAEEAAVGMREEMRLLSSELQTARVLLAERENARADADAELARIRQINTELHARVAQTDASLRERAAAWEREKKQLIELRQSLESDFKALAAEALGANNKNFLQHAEEIFKRHQQKAETTGKAREEAIAGLVKPMQETLKSYQERLADVEKARAESYGGLQAELKNVAALHDAVRGETSKLVNALRAAPKTRGRWGEETLKNILELAGMSPYCDFTTEHHIRGENGGQRPDVLIRLPADRHIIIDAKTSTEAYLAAYEAVEEPAREAELTRHARQLRAHMTDLAKKKYHDALATSLDFTVMFVPGENLFAAAMERDPELFQDALAKSVIITTPTTLIPLLKAIAMGWREEALAENAKQVAELGRELYARISVMGGHLARLGQNLEKGVKSYNDFVGSLETKVMTQARRFEELEVADEKKQLEELKPVELDLRDIRSEKYADLEDGAPAAKRIAN